MPSCSAKLLLWSSGSISLQVQTYVTCVWLLNSLTALRECSVRKIGEHIIPDGEYAIAYPSAISGVLVLPMHVAPAWTASRIA